LILSAAALVQVPCCGLFPILLPEPQSTGLH
jgi:hypothetical protein